VLDLYALDARLGSTRSRLAGLESELARLQAQRRSIDEQLRFAHLDSRLATERVAARLRFIYDYGSGASSLDVVLGATSVEQALTNIDDINDVSAADTDVLAELHAADGRLATLSSALTVRGEQLTEATDALAATASSLAQAQAQRTSYLSGLTQQRSYNDQRIGALTARAQAALARSIKLERAPQTAAAETAAGTPTLPAQAPALSVTPTAAPGAQQLDAAPPALAATGGQTITVVATGYALQGTTATGLPVGYGVAAVDPSVIPLGTHFDVPGYGQAVAADTGGAIVGGRIDLWFPSVAQADAWGVRTVTIDVAG
jgi:3D (Asp-Asp-Asp) domain-containing protein